MKISNRNAFRGRKRSISGSGGFTLVELIIVIAIIAILAVALAPNLIKWVDNSRWSADQADANTLLRDVQNTIVELGSEDKDPGNGKITVTRTAVSTNGGSTEFWKLMNGSDMGNWRSKTVKNHGNAKGSKSQYEITFDSKRAVGQWS